MTPLPWAAGEALAGPGWLLLAGVAALAFTLSAAAGMGGSLLLVPALVAMLGPKEGVAVSSFLLATNNLVKVGAYRAALPWRAAVGLVGAIAMGSALGARLMLHVPAVWVSAAVVLAVAASFIHEGLRPAPVVRRSSALALAGTAGLFSGVSGSSGPLKGIALRSLALDRRHVVGAAALMGLASDWAKAGVFLGAGLLSPAAATTLLALLPLMLLCVALGRHLNGRAGERKFAALFWAVMAGYSARLLLVAL